ncbi:m-AAA protease-interacting protein 1, mitochondrial [Brachyhypopomus gauderio]|uniref:m-AAA protease-interacting protein 1, mitochondrial n=1 Tax=Brachyhypopomus gauderio TaxID=698409 RepID=UPI0040416F51
MALPLLRWSCRRPVCVFTSYLRSDRCVFTRCVFTRCVFTRCVFTRPSTKTPLPTVVSSVRYYSSDREGHKHQNFVVFDIPTPLIWIRNRIYYFLIRTYFDKEFSIEEFTDGAKQAFSHVSQLLSQCQFEALEGLVAKDLIGKLEEKFGNLPLTHKKAISADPDEIVYTKPGDVGIYYDDNGRKFVSILMRFWYVTNTQLPEDTMEGQRMSKRILTANYEFQREFTQGVTPDWTITRIEHSKLLD